MVLSLLSMKQLIVRLDPELHTRLKQRAAEERTSMNTLVTEFITDGLAQTERTRYYRMLEREGRRAFPPPGPSPELKYEEMLELNRGSGTAASEALAAEREESW